MSSSDKLLGVIGRSLIRHAVVGVLTAGIGNAAMLAMDALDVHDAFDAMDAMDSVSSSPSTSGGSPLFGANGNDGFYQSGYDQWGNQVNQSSNSSAPYLASNPSQTVSPNSVTWR